MIINKTDRNEQEGEVEEEEEEEEEETYNRYYFCPVVTVRS